MYSQCAKLNHSDFSSVVQNFTWFKQYMMMNIMRKYDDELKVFLVSCLQKVDYLASDKIEKTALQHIAMHLVAAQQDKGLHLIDTARQGRFEQESMFIIYDGKLAITTEVDIGHEFVVEYIGKGTIINAHNFLSGRRLLNNIKCLTSVTYYHLSVAKLRDLSINYPNLREVINKEQKRQNYNKLLELEPLDYQESYFDTAEKFELMQSQMDHFSEE